MIAENRTLPETPLPEAFLERMKRLLGSEYEDFLDSFHEKRVQGLRLNTGKAPLSALLADCGGRFGLRPVPWCPEGFYYDSETRPGRHPFHEAGAYYIQEPSAMAAVQLLDPQPGERILDLCAAPGGKSTQIAPRMQRKGLLISNEIHPARARILSRNVERLGISNCVVTNEEPARLAGRFEAFFDRILVDAPCSGEGMFRKDEAARGEWSPEQVRLCAARQQQILDQAAGMLKPGGRLLYSTCTFAPEEDEAGAAAFLLRHPEFSVVNVPEEKKPEGLSSGRAEWGAFCREKIPEDILRQLSGTFRVWPHLAGGEGHFMALFEKEREAGTPEEKQGRRADAFGKQKKKAAGGRAFHDPDKRKAVRECLEEILLPGTAIFPEERLALFGDQVYLPPEVSPELSGLPVLRCGLHLGTLKKNRMEPAHALALALRPEQARQVFALDAEGQEIREYLAGNVLPADPSLRGWTLITAGGYSIGWGRAAGGLLKNHYPKGLRVMGAVSGH